MTYRQIESLRETRLWITRVIIPTVVAGAYINSKYPNLKYEMKDKITVAKDNIKIKFEKARS